MGRALATSIVLMIFLAFTLARTMSLPVRAEEQDQARAEEFIKIVRKISENVTYLKDLAKAKGADVASAEKLISEGKALIENAQSTLDKGDYTLAFQKEKEAQTKFRDAIKSLTEPTGETEEEKAKDILAATDRAAERIQRLRETIASISPTTENQNYIDLVNERIGEAEKNLADARSAIEKTPNTSAAAKLLGEANKNMEEALKGLNLIADWTVTWRSENFLNGLERELARVKDQLESVAKKGAKTEDLRARLTEVEETVKDARAKLLNSDKKDALTKIKEARDILQELSKELQKRNQR